MADIDDRIANLSPEKRALLTLRLKKRAGQLKSSQIIPKREIASPCPLSFAQQRLWFLSALEPGNPYYNSQQAIRLNGTLDRTALARSLAKVVERHESLRTTFIAADGEPRQVIHPPTGLPISVVDLRGIGERGQIEDARRIAWEDARRPFDLAVGPLLRLTLLELGPEDHILQMTIHHIICDGWSIGILSREIGSLYESFRKGEDLA